SPKQTFSHKFDTAGEFPYFCQLHPTMVGKVVVS
ncbi:MAG: plastocyanin/azurin family copper-binding protein, partial [Nitrososphaeraceae archaeon]